MVSPMDTSDFTEYNHRLQNRKVFMHMINILLDNMHFRFAQQSKGYVTEYLAATFKIQEYFKFGQKLLH